MFKTAITVGCDADDRLTVTAPLPYPDIRPGTLDLVVTRSSDRTTLLWQFERCPGMTWTLPVDARVTTAFAESVIHCVPPEP